MFLISLLNGDCAGTHYRLQKDTSLGRGRQADIALPHDTQISSLHARLHLSASGLLIEDLASTNGTFLNNHKLPAHTPVLLMENDSIRLGQTLLLVGLPDPQGFFSRYEVCHWVSGPDLPHANLFVTRHKALAVKRYTWLFPTNTLRVQEKYAHEVFHELRASILLHHPNILALVDFGQDDNFLHATFQYFPRETHLPTIIEEKQRQSSGLPLVEVLNIARQIASALVLAHALEPPVCHLNLSPASLFWSHSRIVIAGFTFLKRFIPQFAASLFQAPEQRQNLESEKCDIYSLGVLILYLFTGQTPLSSQEVSASQIHPSQLLRRYANWPTPLSGLLGQLLDPHPRSRPNASQVQRDLDGLWQNSLDKK